MGDDPSFLVRAQDISLSLPFSKDHNRLFIQEPNQTLNH